MNAAALLGPMIQVARKIHQREPWLVEAAVLDAWRGLAGAQKWDAAMVQAVKREMARY
jgi:hypothetical protein